MVAIRRALNAVACFLPAVGMVLVAGCGSMPGRGAAVPAAVRPSQRVITIDPGIDETFTRSGGRPRLTANQAWGRFATGARFRTRRIPPEWHVALGRLTLPSNDVGPRSGWTYTAHHALVWGYSSRGLCDVSSLQRRIRHNCVQWVFLSAPTGRLIDKTQQTPT